MTFYMFNVTNPEEAMNEGAKPNVSIVGPFNYLETRVKHDIAWSEDKTTVRFLYNRTFTIVETPCPEGELYPDILCSLNDSMLITTGNIPLMAAADLLGGLFNPLYKDFIKNNPDDAECKPYLLGWPRFTFADLDRLCFSTPRLCFTFRLRSIDVTDEKAFMTRPASEIIWGYTDPWLDKLDPSKAFIQLQTNNTPAIWTKYSEQYTGKVRRRGRRKESETGKEKKEGQS